LHFPLPLDPHAGTKRLGDTDSGSVHVPNAQIEGDRVVDHPATRSRKKLQKVYVLMSQQTRGRLKLVAGFKNMKLFDLLDTLCVDYIRGWEKLNKIDLDKMQDAETKRSGKAPVKRAKA
jgi:hypothetical protein